MCVAVFAVSCDAVDAPEEVHADGVAGKADEIDGLTCGNGLVEAGEECDGTPCCTDECSFVDTNAPIVEPASAMGPTGTYPRATLLSDGRLLGVYERGENGHNVLKSTISDDGGITWRQLGTIASAPARADRTFGNPQVAQLRDGTLLTSYRHHDRGANGNTNYRLLVSASTDGGRSWKFRGEIEVYGAPRFGIWEPFLFVTPSGRLQAYYAKERAGYEQDILVKDSTDGGRTWGPSRVVARAAGSRDGMPGVTALKDGSLVAIFEAFRQPGVNNTFVVRTVQSRDDGRTWHHRRNVYVHGPKHKNAGAPQISTLADGRLVASFMSDGPSDATNWPGNAATYIMVSRNVPSFGNIDWNPLPIQVTGVRAFWPGLVQGPLDNPVVLVDKGGPKAVPVCLP